MNYKKYLIALSIQLLILSQSDLSATTITPVPGSPFLTPNVRFSGLCYSPNGKWLACANNDAYGTVSIYDVAPDGVITQISGSPFATNGSGPECASYSPDNKFLVVGNFSDTPSTISLFSVNQTTGALTQLDPSTGAPSTNTLATGGTQLETIYYSPNGKFVAAALYNFGVSTIGMYTVNTGTGALTLAGNFPTHPLEDGNSAEIAFSPDSMFIAQANYDVTNTITIFTVNQTTGVLNGPGTDYGVPGGSGLFSSIAYSPDGNLLVVSDENNNLFTFTLSGGVPTFASMISPTPSQIYGSTVDTSVVFSPNSQFIALANDLTTNLFVFSVDSNGNMSQFAELSAPFTGAGITDLVFSPINSQGLSFLSGSGELNITSYAFQFIPATPTNVIGARKNNVFLDKTECILAITWTASASTNVVSYNIYNGTTLVGNVLATSPLLLNALISCCDSGNNFFVTAVSSTGSQSAPVTVVVQ